MAKEEIKDKNGKPTIILDGNTGDITLGGDSHDGDLFLTDDKGNKTIHLGGHSEKST